MASNRSFNHRTANTFLTYSRCDLTPEHIGEHIWEILRPWTPEYVLVASELHQDGGLHLHALAQTERNVRTTNSRFFDIGEFHPNVQSAKSCNKVREYILKDPVIKFEKGSFQPRKSIFYGTAEKQSKTSRDDIMKDIIEHATSKHEYLSMVRKAFPYDWATKLQYFEYSANSLFPVEAETYTNPHPPSEPSLLCEESIKDWMQNDLFQVSPSAYMLYTPTCYSLDEAISDLQWMDNTSRQLMAQESAASTSSGQQGQGKQPGLEA